ncbi:electron transfer flavoprotein subunit beta [Marinomonas flavescens]|uniref:electron transfer flavoprotein subunit beta n=1 Tax=Marinomonas flavescens TaxID=2529379 RepID=UPI00105513B4|nr:electron transfer flavoprotein subunit beta [Marinomonas flavescens]
MSLNVVSLVSVGRHPQSGRARRADQDGRAVELGLKLVAKALSVVHVGDPDDPVLRQYAGMGLPSMTILKQDKSIDAVPILSQFLQQEKIDIVLTGVRAESGESSGMVPYLLAHALGWPVVARVADIVSVKDGEAQVLLALPRGQRRAVSVKLPFIASVDHAAEIARQSAFALGLRASIESVESVGEVDRIRVDWQESVAKSRPKRLKTVKAKTAAERFKAATAKPEGGTGKVMKNETPKEKARAIFDLLLEEKVIR